MKSIIKWLVVIVFCLVPSVMIVKICYSDICDEMIVHEMQCSSELSFPNIGFSRMLNNISANNAASAYNEYKKVYLPSDVASYFDNYFACLKMKDKKRNIKPNVERVLTDCQCMERFLKNNQKANKAQEYNAIQIVPYNIMLYLFERNDKDCKTYAEQYEECIITKYHNEKLTKEDALVICMNCYYQFNNANKSFRNTNIQYDNLRTYIAGVTDKYMDLSVKGKWSQQGNYLQNIYKACDAEKNIKTGDKIKSKLNGEYESFKNIPELYR